MQFARCCLEGEEGNLCFLWSSHCHFQEHKGEKSVFLYTHLSVKSHGLPWEGGVREGYGVALQKETKGTCLSAMLVIFHIFIFIHLSLI